MRTAIVVFCSIVFISQSNGQLIKISPTSIYNTYNTKILVFEDSIIRTYDYPLICYLNIQVAFNEAFYDECKNTLRLTGKVCFRDTSNCVGGMPEVEIFKARVDKGTLFNKVDIGDTFGLKDSTKAGHFDITFFLKRDESLFFNSRFCMFFLEEFRIGELLDNMSSQFLSRRVSSR